MKPGSIPVLTICGTTIPHAYESAIKEVWENASIRPSDRRGSAEPGPTVIITVGTPSPTRFTIVRRRTGGLSNHGEWSAPDFWSSPGGEVLKGS
jgi:hypothetical protein